MLQEKIEKIVQTPQSNVLNSSIKFQWENGKFDMQ